MPAYTHAHHCSLFKTGAVKINYVRTFEVMLGYKWWDIFHGVCKENRLHRLTRAVLFLSTRLSTRTEYMHVYTKSTREYFLCK